MRARHRPALIALASHWRRHPLQLFSLVVGLALATALWSGVQAINAEARASYAAAAEALASDLPVLTPRDGGSLPETAYVALRRAGWQVTPVVEGRLAAEGGSLRLIGIEPLTGGAAAGAPGDFAADPLAFLRPPGRLVSGAAAAARLAGRDDLPPVSIAADVPAGLVFTDIGVAQRVLGTEGRLTRLLVLPDQPLGRPPLETVAPDLVLSERGGDDLGRLTDSFHLNLTAFGLLSFVVGLFIVHGAIGLAFEQRRPMIRTLRALGLPLRGVLALLSAELLALALVAGAAGVLIGWLIAGALMPGVAATLRGLYGAPVEGTLALRPAWWLSGLAVSVLGTAVAASAALWRVAHLPILAPAQPRAWARASERGLRRMGLAAGGLALLALAAGLWGGGIVGGFVLLGALLLAAALALPPVLWLALRAGERMARGAVATWVWADTRQQLPGLSLVLMALLLALAANIGVGTMVSSFRLTFTGWLDQRLAAELYVTAPSAAEAERLVAWLGPRAEAILPIVEVEAEVLGAPAGIFGVADHATYHDNWPLLAALPDVWDRLAEGRGALVNEQLARRERLAPGDALALPGLATEVAGIYSDYGNPRAQILLGLAQFDALYPEAERRRFGVRVEPDQASALVRAIVEEAGIPETGVVEQATLKRLSLEIFERTFAVTAALNVLTLGVAGFAILTALLTLASIRLPQLAPVWAAGMTRTSLAGLELGRALLLAGFTFVLAVPTGLLLAWALLAVVNVEAFGWRLPMHVFPGDWLRLGLLALIAAGLAALWPARRLVTRPAADLVKVFAQER